MKQTRSKKQKEYYSLPETIKNRKEYYSRPEIIAKTKKYYRNLHLGRNHGITTDDYNKMFNEQNGCCKICDTHQSEFKQALSVDHCHLTNKIRGLLCDACNLGLGKFKDKIDLLEKAIDYLKC